MIDTRNLYRFIWMSRPVMQAAEALVERNLQGTGLTVRMRAVMEILAENGPMPVPAIGRTLHIQRQYVQLMINETLAADFTHKLENPAHQRSPLIALTDTGERLIQEIITRERTIIADMCDALDPTEVEIATRVTAQVLNLLLARTQENGR